MQKQLLCLIFFGGTKELVIFSAFHLRQDLDTCNFNFDFLSMHPSGKDFVGCFYHIHSNSVNKFCWILTAALLAILNKKNICLFHPVNKSCIFRKRNYNNCIFESILIIIVIIVSENTCFAPTDICSAISTCFNRCVNKHFLIPHKKTNASKNIKTKEILQNPW